ncbi:MAG: hypothetical protein ABIS50_10795 [Luteolibacter sp.]|uniref:hypothetical protein n=1 Tax=Luteolibacter sp. TaxID=1962973 RepID=UPI0032652DB8
MKTTVLLAISSAILGFAAPLHAGTVTYQVTGPVLEVTDAKIVIQKDTEKWEIARTADTKVTGVPKVGSKVTVQYTMTAASIEVKPDKAAAKTAPAPAAPVPATPAAPAKPEKKPK